MIAELRHDYSLLAAEVERLLCTLASTTDSNTCGQLESSLTAFRDDPQMFIPVLIIALSVPELNTNLPIFCLSQLPRYTANLPDAALIIDLCIARLSRSPENPERSLLAETIAALALCQSDLSVRFSSLAIDVVPIVLSNCLAKSESDFPSFLSVDLIKQVLAQTPRNSEWLRLETRAIERADCAEFGEFLEDTLQLVSGDLPVEFLAWFKAVMATRPLTIGTGDYMRTVVVFVIKWIMAASIENSDLAWELLQRILRARSGFWVSVELADLAGIAFNIALEILQNLAEAKSSELFFRYRDFAYAIAGLNDENGCLNPIDWTIAGLELGVRIAADFDACVYAGQNENDRLTQLELFERKFEWAILYLTFESKFPGYNERVMNWFEVTCHTNFTPGLWYVISYASHYIRKFASQMAADRLIDAIDHPSVLVFIKYCCEFRLGLSEQWLSYLMHSHGPLSKIVNAANALSSEAYLSHVVESINWLVHLLLSTRSIYIIAKVLSILIKIACKIPETHPNLEQALEMVMTVFIQQISRCSDVDELNEIISPISIWSPPSSHMLLIQFLELISHAFFEKLECFWREPDRRVQEYRVFHNYVAWAPLVIIRSSPQNPRSRMSGVVCCSRLTSIRHSRSEITLDY
jgi:hypothetical protein